MMGRGRSGVPGRTSPSRQAATCEEPVALTICRGRCWQPLLVEVGTPSGSKLGRGKLWLDFVIGAAAVEEMHEVLMRQPSWAVQIFRVACVRQTPVSNGVEASP